HRPRFLGHCRSRGKAGARFLHHRVALVLTQGFNIVPTLTETRMHQLVRDSLMTAGLTLEEATACADASVFSDLRGATTHAIDYTHRRTLESMREGKTASGSRPVVVRDGDASALASGAGVAGPVLAIWAMKLAMEKARNHGIGFVNTFNGNGIGLLGYYAN